MDTLSRKLFKTRDARKTLRDMGGIMSSSPELAQEVQRFQDGALVTAPGPDYGSMSLAQLGTLANQGDNQARAVLMQKVDEYVAAFGGRDPEGARQEVLDRSGFNIRRPPMRPDDLMSPAVEDDRTLVDQYVDAGLIETLGIPRTMEEFLGGFTNQNPTIEIPGDADPNLLDPRQESQLLGQRSLNEASDLPSDLAYFLDGRIAGEQARAEAAAAETPVVEAAAAETPVVEPDATDDTPAATVSPDDTPVVEPDATPAAAEAATAEIDFDASFAQAQERIGAVMGEDSDEDSRKKAMANLAMIGLAIAAGQSPNALTNIAQGALAGMQGIQRSEAAEKAAQREANLSALEMANADVRLSRQLASAERVAGMRARSTGSTFSPQDRLYNATFQSTYDYVLQDTNDPAAALEAARTAATASAPGSSQAGAGPLGRTPTQIVTQNGVRFQLYSDGSSEALGD